MRGDAARQIAQVGMIADTGILRQVGRDDLLHPGDLRLRQQIEVRAALHGAIDGACDGGRQHIVGNGAGGAAVDQFTAVGVVDVEAFAGLAAERILGELHKHGTGPRWDR